MTSLSVVHYAETAAVPPPTEAKGTPRATTAAAAAAAALADASSDHSGDDDRSPVGPPSWQDAPGRSDSRGRIDIGSKPARDGGLASDSIPKATIAASAVEPGPEAEAEPGPEAEAEPGPEASAAGVYVAVGLETGAVEVVRLSRRRAGTRLFDLVDTAGRSSDRQPSAWEAAVTGTVDDGGGGEGGSGGGGVRGKDAGSAPGDVKRPGHAGEPAPEPLEGFLGGKSPGGDCRERRDSVPGAGGGGGGGGNEDGVGSLRLDGENNGTEKDVRLAAATGPTASTCCGWRVPADVDDGKDACSSCAWEGPGVVVGLSHPAHAAAAAAAAAVAASSSTSFAATPNTPLPHVSTTGLRGWGWGRTAEVSAGGGGGGKGGVGEGDDEDRMFAVCTLNGFVRCCRVESTVGGQPRWRNVWTRQTKVTFG